MSILLEALRKSEKSQRTREVPTIHSEVPSSMTARPFKSVPLIILLVLTFIVCGWLIWKQYNTTAVVEEAVTAGPFTTGAEEKAAGDGSTTTPVVKLPVLSNAAETGTAANTTSVPGTDGTEDASNPTRSGSQVVRQRTPMESYRAAKREKSNAAKLAELAVPPQPRQQSGSNSRSFPSVTAESRNRQGLSDGSSATEQPYQPPAPGVLGYWDLPDSVRAGVPEITFSVLVYDKDPENRFVLINGERLAEGDAHQPGLIVEEIRREGVVFSYRLYRFLIEK